jgi:hypothetical protein
MNKQLCTSTETAWEAAARLPSPSSPNIIV